MSRFLICLLLLWPLGSQAARFWGRILSADGTAVAWPVIQVLGGPHGIGDSRGYFALPDVSTGTLQLLIEAPGHYPLRQNFLYHREGAAQFVLVPWSGKDLSSTPGDLLQQVDRSATGSIPAFAAQLWPRDRDGDGLAESLFNAKGSRSGWNLDGQPLLGRSRDNLRGLDRLLPETRGPRQFQPGGQAGALFRDDPHGALWAGGELLVPRVSHADPAATPEVRPLAGSLALGAGSEGESRFQGTIDLRLLPQDPLRLSWALDGRTGDNGLGAHGQNTLRGVELKHQRALKLGVLNTGLLLDDWSEHAPIPAEREEWLLATGSARETGRRARGTARWLAPLTQDLRVRLDLQLESRHTLLEREELDRLYQRGYSSTDFSSEAWFDTRRNSEMSRAATAFSVDWSHSRGRFQLALWLERVGEDRTGAIDDGPGIPAGETAWDSWFHTRDATFSSGLRLKDRYALRGPLSLDLQVDARYQYYRFERLPNQATGSSGNLAFDDNQLVLEPRLALILTEQERTWQLGWSRFNPMLDPLDYWDLNRSPESATSEPLFVADASGVAVPRLRTARLQRLDLGLEHQSGRMRSGIQLWYDRLEGPIGAWYKSKGEYLPDPQLSNGGRLESLNSDFWADGLLSGQTRLRASFQLGVSRWRNARLILPLEPGPASDPLPPDQLSGTLYYGAAGRFRLRDLDRLAGNSWPTFAMFIGLSREQALPAGLVAELGFDWEYRGAHDADPSGQAGLRLPGTRELSAAVELESRALKGWGLRVEGHNLLDRRWQSSGVVSRPRDGGPATLTLLPAAPLRYGVTLMRSW
ncbi:MAG: carboxypeptidase regulatory-like domain-containing protein [Candidatus Cloacimonetes bacterium]|nr:carboxypeptidase regulatory-like domain-containing protein [Candidatus Cloacimonadota bacterium]